MINRRRVLQLSASALALQSLGLGTAAVEASADLALIQRAIPSSGERFLCLGRIFGRFPTVQFAPAVDQRVNIRRRR